MNTKVKKIITIKDSVNTHIGNTYINNHIMVSISQNMSSETHNENSSLPITGQSGSSENEELFSIYREKLMNQYKTTGSFMKSLCWEERSKNFPIKDYFVELKIQEVSLLGMKTGKYIQLKEIFNKAAEQHSTILITGDPGCGKTTICKKIAYDWSNNVEYLRKFFFVIVITLRELGKKAVIDAIVEGICKKSESDRKIKIRKANLNFLIILDGFDEMYDRHSLLEFIRNDFIELSKYCTVIITSRPYTAEELREDVQGRFSIERLTSEQQKEYIRQFFRQNEYHIKNILKHLQYIDNSSLRKLAECPLMLHLLCCLHKDEDLGELKKLTDLYIQIFRRTIDRYIRKNEGNHNLIKGKYFYGEEQLIKLGRLLFERASKPNSLDDKEYRHLVNDAIDGYYDFNKIFELYPKSDEFYIKRLTKMDLMKTFPNENEYNFITSLDILEQSCDSKDVIYFDFIHNTFKEFLLALSQYIPSVKFLSSEHFIPFLFGLYGDNRNLENISHFLNEYVLNYDALFDAWQEIDDEHNKKIFSSQVKLLTLRINSDDLKKLLNDFKLKQIYCYIIDSISEDIFEHMKNELIKFHKMYNHSYKLEILFVVGKYSKYAPVNKLSTDSSENAIEYPQDFIDIRETVEYIKNMFEVYEWSKFKLYFYGVAYYQSLTIAVHEKSINIFTAFEHPAHISNEDSHSTVNDAVALNSINPYERKISKYLISLEQFKVLQPYIKFSSYEI